nr:PABP1D [Diplonema papillatum]
MSQSASLYVGDLKPEVNEAILFELFRNMGPVLSIKVCRDNTTRKSLGYAFVNFQNPLDAEKAVETMNNCSIKDQPCRIMWAHKDPSLRKSDSSNIFIKNLTPDIDNKVLYDTFSAFGKILSAKVELNDEGKSLGYGFVNFQDEESANSAIDQVNGMLLQGQQVYVGKFERKEQKLKQLDSIFTNCYVKFLNKSLSDDEATTFFSRYGKVQSMKLARDEAGVSKGFAFVNFENHEDAARFVDDANESEPEGIVEPGFQLYCGRHQRKSERDHTRRQEEHAKSTETMKHANLYVKNLDDSVTSEMLKEAFDPFGHVISARIMCFVENQVSKGFGFVCFEHQESALKATQILNGSMFHGKPLFITTAQSKDERKAQLEALHGHGPSTGKKWTKLSTFSRVMGNLALQVRRPAPSEGLIVVGVRG